MKNYLRGGQSPSTILVLLTVLGMLAIALFHGLRATRGLDWHPGSDGFRDIALAQTILDGDYPDDYLVKGAWLWYNPLVGAIVAAGAWVADVPPSLADVRMGPYLNLLVPIAFFGLLWYVADVWVALAALVSFLFVLPQERPAFVSASYSPWMIAPHLLQGAFYGTIALWCYRGPRSGWCMSILAGMALGLTFLGHAAPAVLLGGTFAISTVYVLWTERVETKTRTWSRWRPVGMLALTLLIAFIASLPFTISILFRYHLHVVNSAPSQWVWGGVALERLPDLLRGLVHWRTPVMVLGLYGFMKAPVPRYTKVVMLSWPLIALALLGYNYLGQWATKFGTALPQLTPGYHYLLYLIAAGHILFGLGVVTSVRGAVALAERVPRLKEGVGKTWVGPTVFFLVIATLFVGNYRDFRAWHGFTRDRTVAQKRIAKTDNYAPLIWIRDTLEPGSVFLCDDFTGIFCVAPAGGRVVASDPRFMNLYVPYEPRAAAREVLWAALAAGDSTAFRALAEEYELTHILATQEQQTFIDDGGVGGMKRVFESEHFAIYAVVPIE